MIHAIWSFIGKLKLKYDIFQKDGSSTPATKDKIFYMDFM
jgi:hypothetical protein